MDLPYFCQFLFMCFGHAISYVFSQFKLISSYFILLHLMSFDFLLFTVLLLHIVIRNHHYFSQLYVIVTNVLAKNILSTL